MAQQPLKIGGYCSSPPAWLLASSYTDFGRVTRLPGRAIGDLLSDTGFVIFDRESIFLLGPTVATFPPYDHGIMTMIEE